MQIGLTRLTDRQKEVLREMAQFTCEDCGRQEEVCGKLEPHRIIRGADGGKYLPRNIKLLCKECHENYDYI
jgi:hypothetical protein